MMMCVNLHTLEYSFLFSKTLSRRWTTITKRWWPSLKVGPWAQATTVLTLVLRETPNHKNLNKYDLLGAQESELEALALLHGANLANEWGLRPIIFESDSASVVKAFQNDDDNLSYLRSIIHDFRSIVPGSQDWKCVYAKRVQNKVAHECAAYVRRVGVGCI
jgi:ribonuclease HI